jgi:hypothetical protein
VPYVEQVAENEERVELDGEAAPRPLNPPNTKVIIRTSISRPTAISIIVLMGNPCPFLFKTIVIY